MATTKKRNAGGASGRVSPQRHEIGYAGKKASAGGTTRVRKAKKALGRKTSRKAAMSRARSSK